ncbi:MAG: site-specific integrase [Gemmatimonadetes bacterium]|nr:site-specific integrase [Gemmatimonadota bacterium]
MGNPLVPDDVARDFYLERFDDFLSLEQGSSERTREAYGRDVARLAVFAVTRSVRAPAALELITIGADLVYQPTTSAFARIDSAQRLGGAHLFPISRRRRGRDQRPERPVGDAAPMARPP